MKVHHPRRVLATGVALLCIAAAPAAASASNGVGNTPGTTGQSRACLAHASNNGASTANGMQCGSLTLTFAGYWDAGVCGFAVSGTGLQGGAPVYENVNGTQTLIGYAATDGTFNGSFGGLLQRLP
jgi:hypothetical protein